MARKIIDIGAVGNDGTGDSIRDSFRKVNDNFRELYSSLGLGERLTFIGLDDSPETYVGQNDATTGSTPLVTVNNTESGLAFKRLVPGNGISIDFITNPDEITINADFAEISADTTPQLGGDLSMKSGGIQYRIFDAGTNSEPLNPIYKHELVNKYYADTKIAKAGVNAINPETGLADPSFGRMSGPLILARDPEPDDDINYDGLTAATKRYVDNSAFGSSVNLYVATSGQDERNGVSKSLQGRALAYAYRTLEAALKRAEELVNEANLVLGPYKKVLTYNNGQSECTLSSIESSPLSGSGFVGSLRMSVETVTLTSVGVNYYPGDVLVVNGGTVAGGPCYIQVLSTLTTPGSILTYRIVSSGSYSSLPGSTDVATSIYSSAAPSGVGSIGEGAKFDITYKVNSVSITNGGTGYSLVSVRVSGGGGSGSFGTAVVNGGVITSITITDKGTGFTSLPTLSVDLPRFLIYTNNYRTDFTGDVTTGTLESARGRDIREGLYLRGETSGALAEILSHQGALDSSGNEIFDVDIKYGVFQTGETISYGDISKNIQISVLVESGEYYENYPLKVPANVSIVGDEFRRVIFHPKDGTSSSPWAFQRFRRDKTIGTTSTTKNVFNSTTQTWTTQERIADSLDVAVENYGFHYLQDPTQPVYPQIYNPGDYTAAAALLDLNRAFLQEEIIAWMNYNITNNVTPFTSSFDYNNTLCKRDVGLLVDSISFDLKYGSYNRTISAGLKYYQSASARIAITTQLSQYLAVLTHLESLMQSVIDNSAITGLKQTNYAQTIDPAYTAETGADDVITDLVTALKDVIDGSGSVNYPLENQEMDVFLANDAVRWQAISAIGHGGFMCVLDPEGQILSRSPYAQECASFSRSKDTQVFAGGMLVDGFAGNLEFVITNILSSTRIEVSGLDRFPQTPASFIVGETTYRVNYIRDFEYGVGNFNYNSTKCARDVGIIVQAILDDYILGTNYKHVIAGISYVRSYTSVVTNRQKKQTIAGLNYARDRVLALMSDSTFETFITSAFATVTDIIEVVNASAAPALSFTAPVGVTSGVGNSYQELRNNRTFLMDEITAYIDSTQSPGSITTYDEDTCRRDVGYFIDAISYDIYYGGNSATVTAASAYFNGSSTQILGSTELTPSINSFTRLKAVIGDIITGNTSWTKSTGNTSTQSTTGGVGTEDTEAEDLVQIIIDVLTGGLGVLPSVVDPTFTAGTNYASHNASKATIVSNLTDIKNDTIDFINAAYASGSSATFVLDETTPWPYEVFTYNSTACERDVGLILDGLGYDIVFGTNYWTRINGLSYRMSQSSEVILNQRSITIRSIDYAHELVKDELTAYTTIQDSVDQNNAILDDIIDRGTSALPTLTFTLPTTLSTNKTNAYNLLMANRDYIVAEVDGWIKAQISGNISPWATGDTYNEAKSQRDTKLVLEAVAHDFIYGGNVATRQAALKYYNNLTGDSMLATGQAARCSAAIEYANTITKRIIQNLAPTSTYSSLTRTTGTAATATEATIIDGLMDPIVSAISADDYTTAQTFVTLSAPTISSSDYSTDNIAARTLIQTAKAGIQQDVIDFVNTYGNRYELIMPGNRSMLANDFTQINDMGYGAIAVNGGLLELVSVFTYYCYISYYSLRGGQIRSVGGSSAHGVYALVAEGADPLETPTPTTLYDELSQRVDCYFPSSGFANVKDGLSIYVTNYNTVPLGGSELEILHGTEIYRYPVTSVTTQDLPDGVARLNLSTGTGTISQGLEEIVPDGTKMTLRQNSIVRLTGGLSEVAVRPSTGLKLRETNDNVYRILQFTAAEDLNGPYEITASVSDPSIFRVYVTVTEIDTDVCTTSGNHKLTLGDKFIPTTTANGLTSGTTYFVIDVPKYNQFKLSTAPGGSAATLTNGTGLSIKGSITHKLIENYTIKFSASAGGSLPTGLNSTTIYYVRSAELTDTEFSVSTQKNGPGVEVTAGGSGTHYYSPEGITVTNLRENYNFVDLTIYQPGEYTSDYPTGRSCTISVATEAVITTSVSHGFSAGDVVKFTTSGTLPNGLYTLYRYFVISDGLTSTEFKVSLSPGGDPVGTTGLAGSGHMVGRVTGNAGEDTFAVVAVGSNEISRVAGSKFVFLGEEYTISTYQPESVTNQPYARVILNRPLVDSINSLTTSYTIRSGVAVRSSGSLGTLTIRISLTRVTSHDLLEIGTGSYADTNYPKEIYGQSVNALNPDIETEERDVGRCFYVTTDQYGNFSVGPYFRVDQGTGQVTFSSSIALSNLDGIGFKRGVPVAEFSTDSAFTDNATDTVPTENATRIYIERRLGVTHDGANVDSAQMIPTLTGGFLPLSGQLAMKGDVDLDNHKIINATNPTNPQDVVNLRSLTFANFQNTLAVSSPTTGQLLSFTGSGSNAINVTITGDVTATRSSSNLDIQLNAGVINNAEVNAAADIVQSKLLMTIADSHAAAPTGTAAEKQARSGLSSYNSSDFTVTDGWVSLKVNSVALTDIAQISSKTVLGNSTLTSGDVTAVSFSDVVDAGLSIKKNQYSSTGFLRRISGSSFVSDVDYSMIEGAAGSSSSVEASKIVIRDSNGDFGGRIIDVQSVKVDAQTVIDTTTISTGGYTRFYGYNSAGGVLIQDGTTAGDKTTSYWNDAHTFKTQNGVSLAPITASSIQVTAITSGGNTTAGTITGRWTLTGTSPNESRLQATYSADLAENYEGDKEYEVGTVLVFGGEKEVTTSGIKGDTRVAGVVSNTAAFAMYDGCPGFKNLVALQGRVPCKVVGKIKKGDILVTSGIPGVATAATGDVKVGTVVGKALYDYDSDHIGTLEIAVGRT